MSDLANRMKRIIVVYCLLILFMMACSLQFQCRFMIHKCESTTCSICVELGQVQGIIKVLTQQGTCFVGVLFVFLVQVNAMRCRVLFRKESITLVSLKVRLDC